MEAPSCFDRPGSQPLTLEQPLKQPPIQTGYLVLADLTGFTPFVAGAEIDHAQVILTNIMDLLRSHLTPALTLAEVEGDALFLYAPSSRLPRGETLLELIESTYVAFLDRQHMMQRNAVCPCEACRMIPTLDLKFVTHFGEYVLQATRGDTKPFGSCVNFVHRLLKNEVTGATGWRAYALFTKPALDTMRVAPAGMHSSEVSYPHLGSCEIGAIDLRQRYEALTSQRVSYLAEDDAHITVRRTYALPRPRLWELLVDPERRNQWEFNADWSVLSRPGGRSGAGTTNHCAASDFLEELLDWRPFDYYTAMLRYRAIRLRITGELSGENDIAMLRWSMALESVVPGPLRGPACRFFATRLMRVPARFARLDRLVETELRSGTLSQALA
jgi:hypothetical protein